MLTIAQMSAYEFMVDGTPFEDRVTPRFTVIPSDQLDALAYTFGDDVIDAQYGDGTILYAAVKSNDPELRECECGELHVTYAPVRADGMTMPIVESGTFGELLDGPPIPWDEAYDVTVEMWPTIDVLND